MTYQLIACDCCGESLMPGDPVACAFCEVGVYVCRGGENTCAELWLLAEKPYVCSFCRLRADVIDDAEESSFTDDLDDASAYERDQVAQDEALENYVEEIESDGE